MSLVLADVGYRYAGAREPSLLEVDLELRDGAIVGVAGASESGKSTLCLVAAGIAPRTIGGMIRGRIELDGTNVDGWPMHRLAQHVSIGFQSPATQLSQVATTTFEEVAFGPMNMGLPRDDVLDRTHQALATMGIAELAARDPRRLSGGQQQLVAIAGLLALRPAHLILDEPTAQLDPQGTRLVADALQRLAASGASILIAEQKTDLLAELATTTVVLRAGRVAFSAPTAEALADPRLAEAGVLPPAAHRLRAAAAAVGVAGPAVTEALARA